MLGVIEAVGITTADPARPAFGEILGIPGTLVSFWSRDDRTVPEYAEARAALIAPDGARAGGKSILKIQLQDHLRTRTLLGFPSIQFRGQGEYRFEMEMRRGPDAPWEVVTTIPFDLTVTVQSPPAETQHEP